MRTDLNRCSVNIVGSWNQAIFTPEWVALKLGIAPTSLKASIGFLPVGVFIRFDIEHAAITLLPGQLQLQPLKDETAAWDACERVATTILRTLPETPVQALGINVGLDLDESPEVRAVIDLPDLGSLAVFGARIETVAVQRRVRLDDHQVNFTLTREAASVRLDVNHHFDTRTTAAAADAVEGAIARTLAVCSRIARDVYGTKDGG